MLAQKKAQERWEQVKGKGPEKLVSGSDDFTMYLWEPAEKKQPLLRMTGHGKPINVAQFSPGKISVNHNNLTNGTGRRQPHRIRFVR